MEEVEQCALFKRGQIPAEHVRDRWLAELARGSCPVPASAAGTTSGKRSIAHCCVLVGAIGAPDPVIQMLRHPPSDSPLRLNRRPGDVRKITEGVFTQV